MSVAQDASVGWAPVDCGDWTIFDGNAGDVSPTTVSPLYGQPFYLPITANGYANPAGSTTSIWTSASLAEPRIRYGDPYGSKLQQNPILSVSELVSSDDFSNLHDALLNLVDGGSVNGEMTERLTNYTAPAPTSPPTTTAESMSALDLVLLTSINPAFAQMYGLYWIDQTAQPGVSYDYMVVTDRSNRFNNNVKNVLSWVQNGDFTDEDAYIVFNKKLSNLNHSIHHRMCERLRCRT